MSTSPQALLPIICAAIVDPSAKDPMGLWRTLPRFTFPDLRKRHDRVDFNARQGAKVMRFIKPSGGEVASEDAAAYLAKNGLH